MTEINYRNNFLSLPRADTVKFLLIFHSTPESVALHLNRGKYEGAESNTGWMKWVAVKMQKFYLVFTQDEDEHGGFLFNQLHRSWNDYQRGQCSRRIRHSTHPAGNLNVTWSLVVVLYGKHIIGLILLSAEKREIYRDGRFYCGQWWWDARPENSLQECGGVSSRGIDKLIDNLFWECTVFRVHWSSHYEVS